MKSITAVASLIALTNAQPYTYASNGSDWGTIEGYEDCAKKGGSPIDLKTELSQYKKYQIETDDLKYTFTNQRNVKVSWTGDTTQVPLTLAPNSFVSAIGQTIFGAHTKNWNGVNVHFRSQSEHTINGNHRDLEMQTIFDADPKQDTDNFKGAGLGVMFSVSDFNVKLSKAEQLIIDTFFETLDWAKQDDPEVNLVTYGDMLNMMDLKNRWVYKGSMTTPPCQQKVYWNVLQTVYPIKKKHLDLFKSQLKRGNDGDLVAWGNFRKTQDIGDQAPAVITETSLGSEKDSANDINYNININIYNQNVGGSCSGSS